MLGASADTDYTSPKIIEVSSGLHEFYLRYLSPETARFRAADADRWWANNLPRVERDLDAFPATAGAMVVKRQSMMLVVKLIRRVVLRTFRQNRSMK